ncbi:MAG: cupin domain-containing protein [Mycobacterium sp.]|nr:cupin domain-containing protein [Mycobacterium sp.]
MFNGKLKDIEYRFGDWGPGYLLRGPRTDVGACYLRPGDAFPNHYHCGLEETFFVVEGEATLWIDCKEKFDLQEGDIHRCDPYEMHYFVNESEKPFVALFVKAPFDPDDKVDVPWQPGEAPIEPAKPEAE